MRLEHFDSLFDGIVPSLARILTKQHGIRGGGRIGVRQTQTADWQINEVNIVVECSNRFPIPKLVF